MIRVRKLSRYNLNSLKRAAGEYLSFIAGAANIEVARERLSRKLNTSVFDSFAGQRSRYKTRMVRVRDCARTLNSIMRRRSDKLAGFSVVEALYDIARDVPRPDLKPGFFAEMCHLFKGIQGKGPGRAPGDYSISPKLKGIEAARARSDELDKLWNNLEKQMSLYRHGLDPEVIEYRRRRRRKVFKQLGGTGDDWRDWRWHLRKVIKWPTQLFDMIPLTDDEKESLELVERARLPFGITPYYLSLMNNNGDDSDMAIRAQVIPPKSYAESVIEGKHKNFHSLDFMLERDTSPIELVTRRYPGIVILKPYNTCPQICVYCQRNWEINEVLARGSMASKEKIKAAIEWIADHPGIHDVLVTGGDPLAMSDRKLFWLLSEVAKIPSVERIRIGTRTPVTMPMRITKELADFLGKLRKPLKLDISVVTHVEHPFEVTPQMARAVERLRRRMINVYNQNVFTFFISRRFEAAFLRRLLKRIGIDPYYTFNTKGKDETVDYRVPIARLMQEQKEEARLLPGLSRTDEAVYNVPGLGKNYLRALQHRDLISVLPDGTRVYEFHPWEKNIRRQKSHVGEDVPLLDYLKRLEDMGEDVKQYETIWYYY
ncbi:MAG: KamA family radical SAM protein [candidate division Zixibacteria bacterium]|nr:KamA family radical SAM protein [candidate division Zixibacteria bacterium]